MELNKICSTHGEKQMAELHWFSDIPIRKFSSPNNANFTLDITQVLQGCSQWQDCEAKQDMTKQNRSAKKKVYER